MENSWKELHIKDFADVKGGKRLPLGTSLVSYPTNHPYIRIVDICDGRIKTSSMLYVPEEVSASIKRYIVETNDVVVTIVGTVGLVALIPQALHKANLTENAAKIITNKELVENRYLAYFLKSQFGQNEIFRNTVGSTQLKLPLYGIENVKVNLPPLSTQKAIAHILGTLDDKIELLRQMNETLEAIARALFKSWFVDFDPVRKKAEGLPTGLPPEIDALFPDSFEDSELGEIPKGWDVRPLAEVIQINPHRTLPKGTHATYVEMKNLPQDGMSPNTWEQKEYSGGVKFKNGDTLLARITPCLENGKTSYIQFLSEGEVAFGSTEYLVLAGTNSVPSEWCYLLARDDNFREYAISNMNGSSGRQRVERDSLGRYRVALPMSPEILVSFHDFIQPQFKVIHSQFLETIMLQNLRDSLLSKLISGDLEVKDIDKILEPAT